MLSIHLFGQPRFLLDSTPLKFTAPPKTVPLWACLLLHSQRPLDRASLAFTLWPDIEEKEARANLRRHLHYLQRSLPAPSEGDAPWLLMEGDQIQWNPAAGCWLDVAEFERLSAEPDSLEQAVGLYTGDLLANVYDDCLYPDRERLREIYLADLCQLVHLRRSQREYAQAIAHATQALACEPMREDILRLLISLRYESGDRAGAIREYERFAGSLRREMGVAPMPETRAVYEAVYANTRLPGASTAPAEQAVRRERPSPLPFSGRAAEMDRLSALWGQAVRSHGGLVLISGEAGVGKTRLACELAQMAEKQGARVLMGNTSPGEPRPYQAVTEALESVLALVAAVDLSPVWRAALSTLIPRLASQAPASLSRLPALAPERERDRLFEALATCFQRLAEPRPLLIVLEDVHWAGEATLALIERLARRASQHPILIIATFRSEEIARQHPLRQLRRNLEWEHLGNHLALERLSPQAVADLLAGLPEPRRAPPDQIGWLQTKSEGNPLFIEFLLQQWLDAGCPPSGDTQALPSGIQALITGRLDCLSDQARLLAEVAAVIGASFDVELIQEVNGWEENQALGALNELLDRRLAREAGGKGLFDFVFTHHLIQSVVYAGIPERRLRRWHLRVGQAMQEMYPALRDDRAGELGRHLALGGDALHAIPYLLAAARQDLALYAGEQALQPLSQALQLLAEMPDAPGNSGAPEHLPRLWDALALREEIAHRLGDRETQQADLDQMEQVAEQLDSPELALECLRRRVRHWHAVGQRQPEAGAVQELARRAQQSGEPRWQAEALRAQAALHVALGQSAEVQPGLDRALELDQAAGNVAGQVSCLCLMADAAVQQGRFEAAQAQLDQAHRLAEVKGDYALLVQSLRAAAGALFARQDFSSAQRLASQMLDLCRSIGDHQGEADGLARLGAISTRLFAVPEARQQYEQARTIYSALGNRQGQAAVWVNAGVLAVRLGRYAEGQKSFTQAGELFETMGDIRGQAVCALNLCMAAFFHGDYAVARTAAARGLELARQMQSQVMEANALANLGAAEREMGEIEPAISHMEAGLAIRRSMGQVAELGTDLCDLIVAYLCAGRLEAAGQATQEMLGIYEGDEQAMTYPQYILWAAAQSFRAAGDQVRAAEYLERAWTVMQAQAQAIPDAESRASFFELPFNREIRQAHA